MSTATAETGVFGGSGFYSFLDDVEEIELDTPYGAPSAPVSVGTIEDRRVAFLPRHGRAHQFPPHLINYRANVWAMHSLGVRSIIAPCAAGSLRATIAPGDFVVLDQLVDRTCGRADTFHEGPDVKHVTFADPYDERLRAVILDAAHRIGVTAHDGGTMVVVQGPRFSTRAESRWFASMGWGIINMTGYPEAVLAAELGIAYAGIALITDYDVGLEGMDGIEPVSHAKVLEVFEHNLGRLRELLFATIPHV
jgi:5'-methylthioadenosine phosphorylase